MNRPHVGTLITILGALIILDGASTVTTYLKSKETQMANTPNLPCYRSHKKVWATRILKVEPVSGKPNSRFLIPADNHIDPIEVNVDFVVKHQPFSGGYFVVYEGGYQSFSPAQAFEDGYTFCDDSEGPDPDEESCTAEIDPGGNPINPDTIDPEGLQ